MYPFTEPLVSAHDSPLETLPSRSGSCGVHLDLEEEIAAALNLTSSRSNGDEEAFRSVTGGSQQRHIPSKDKE